MKSTKSKRPPKSKHSVRFWLTFDFLLSCLVIAAIMLWLVYIRDSRTFQVMGQHLNRVETAEKVVALTFDDGPYPGNTENLLAVLQKTNTKATFFMIGLEIKRYPKQAKLIVNAGHEVGNHSYNHAHMAFMSPGIVLQELNKTDKLIQQSGYTKPSLFRPPYGSKMVILPYYLKQQNKTTVMWDVAPDDQPENWGNTKNITNYAVKNVKPGSIIILHPMYPRDKGSLNAVEPIITKLKASGYKFVTVSELMKYR